MGTVLLSREAHSYEYDNNGNILYINTLRLKPDMTAQPDTVQRTREEKFRWDEENRLTALSQNGYVSHYWYDADGDRTVKMHGGSMAVFVNSERDGVYADSDNKNIRENGKVVDTYSLYGNNCTTKSCDALKYAKSKIFNIDGLFFDYDEDYTIPSSLDNYLNDLSNKKNSNVSNETTRLKNLIRKNGQNQLKSAGSVGCSSGSSASSSGSSANSSSSRASSSGNGSGSFGSGSKSSSSQDNN